MKNKEEDVEELVPHVVDGCEAKINDERYAMIFLLLLLSFVPENDLATRRSSLHNHNTVSECRCCSGAGSKCCSYAVFPVNSVFAAGNIPG